MNPGNMINYSVQKQASVAEISEESVVSFYNVRDFNIYEENCGLNKNSDCVKTCALLCKRA